MMNKDNPTCFSDDLLVAVSERKNETMLDRARGVHAPEIVANRRKWCESYGVDYDDVAYQRIIYASDRSYELIADVDQGSVSRITNEVVADALYTKTTGVALLLPIADCVGTVVYDPVRRSLAVAHLGRHSTCSHLVSRLVNHFQADGSNPKDLIVWMAPHARRESYCMDYFDLAETRDWQPFIDKKQGKVYLDMTGYNRQSFVNAGVLTQNIFDSGVDTAREERYFSHMMGDLSGRFVLMAMIRSSSP